MKVVGLLRLMRPANIVTAIADILAGIAIAGFFLEHDLFSGRMIGLVIATIGLYGGGVVYNDVFDASLDSTERPERPIPSGAVSRVEASVLGIVLFAVGISSAWFVSRTSGLIAASIAIAALLYDAWSKHNPVIGPLNMGLCRGLNLLLGVSIITPLATSHYTLMLVPVLYISAITIISRGEVHGGGKGTLYLAAMMYLVVMGSITFFAIRQDALWLALPFLLGWLFMIFRPLIKAIYAPTGPHIGASVKAGVLALIVMNAAWAAAHNQLLVAMAILALLPLSIILARSFAVT